MEEIIRTSDKDWLEKALQHYTEKKAFTFQDDADLKISQADLISAVSLIRAAKQKGRTTWQQIVAVLAGLGITGAGVWIIAAAIVSPEPTTKLGLLVAGGIALALTGAFGTLAGLGVKFVVSAKSPEGHSFEIKPK